MELATDVAPTDLKSRPKSPREKYGFWRDELKQSQKMLRNWHKQGGKIVKRYVDERGNNDMIGIERTGDMFRLNLFHSNVKTQMDMLYGNLPTVEADRTNADAADDVARVAAEMAERLMNLDIQDNGQDYDSVLRSTLQDRLLPGLGVARVRYEVETEEVTVAAVIDPMSGMEIAAETTETRVVWEDAPVDYYHWQDVLWGWGRSFSELPWIAFRSYLSKDQVEARFGKDCAEQVEYTKQKVDDQEDGGDDPTMDSPWQKAEIWEIWDKETRKVCWIGKGCSRILDSKDDPLKLSNFYPCPPLFIANPTTTLYKPTPDYHLSQDLYNEIDRLQTRIAIITEAVKVVGVYDANADGVQRMLNEGVENDLIPVDNWAMFAEGGGIKGKIDWFPIMDVVQTLDKLIQLRDQTIALLQQISGMSDIMRGGLQNQYEGVGQSQIKAQFGSVQMQSLQDQFANFAGHLLQLKLEVICRHFEAQTIVKLANMQYSFDQEYVPQAVQLLKNPDEAHIRIIVRPESVAMVDYARLKSDRTEFMTAMATFLQSAAPMLQQEPDSMPYLLKMLQWTMAGFKGSSEIEGVLDKAVDGAIAKQKQKQGQPDPAQQEAQMKQQEAQAKLQGELQKIQAKSQSDMQIRQQDLQADMQTAMAQHQAKMSEIQATHVSRMREIQAKSEADYYKEQAQMEANITQTQVTAESEMQKDVLDAELDMQKSVADARLEFEQELAKSELKLDEIATSSAAKLGEMITQSELTPEPQQGNDDES